jgi:RHS repeat-associated protein
LLAEITKGRSSNVIYWIHEDPVTKSKRVTTNLGAVVSTIELDPWGADTPRSNNTAFQPKKFTNYERDGNFSDEAMFRRYNRYHSRFDQPDPYEGSYRSTDPQSFNRYAYVQGDPVNFIDPTGLECWATYLVFWQNGKQIGERRLSVFCDPNMSTNPIPGGVAVEIGGGGQTIIARPATPKQIAQLKRYQDCMKKAKELHDGLMDKASAELRDNVFGRVSLGAGGTLSLAEALKAAASGSVGLTLRRAAGGFVIGTLFVASAAGINADVEKVVYDRQYDREVAACKTLPH